MSSFFFNRLEETLTFSQFVYLHGSKENDESTKLEIDNFFIFLLAWIKSFAIKIEREKVESFSLIKIESSEMETYEYIWAEKKINLLS